MKESLMRFGVMNANMRIYCQETAKVTQEMDIPLLIEPSKDMIMRLEGMIGSVVLSVKGDTVYGDMTFHEKYEYMEELISTGHVSVALAGIGVMSKDDNGDLIVNDFDPKYAFISETNAWFKPE